ncbi:MAG: hypothetical protein MZV65_25540 [Chromatiales bacterium]|nr:hypothetical protein [Chromatiales bacterium]
MSIYATGQSETHEGQVFAWTNLALTNIGLGKFAVAEPLLQRALNAAIATQHRLEGPILTDLADLECRTQRAEEGLARLDSARPSWLSAIRMNRGGWRSSTTCTRDASRESGARRRQNPSSPAACRY